MTNEKNEILNKGLTYEILDRETATKSSQGAFNEILEAYKFLPNLTGAMANHPALLNTYWYGNKYLEIDKLFTHQEQQVIFLVASYENNCHYCVAAHSTIAKMYNVPGSVIEAVRAGETIPDAKLEALRQYTKATVIKRGRVSDDEVKALLTAGYSRNHLLEVIVIVALKVLTNYLNFLAKTPVDKQFLATEWHPRN